MIAPGTQFALVSPCGMCGGTGRVAEYSAGSSGLGPGWGSQVAPTAKCPNCIQGFRFERLDVMTFTSWLMNELMTNTSIQQAVLDAVVRATEAKMSIVEPAPAPGGFKAGGDVTG